MSDAAHPHRAVPPAALAMIGGGQMALALAEGFCRAGLLKPSDITVFDPQTFRDRATFDAPYLPPTGVRYVLVAGAFAVYDGQATGTLNGRSLRKASSK